MPPPERILLQANLLDLQNDLATVRTASGLPPGTRVRFEIGDAGQSDERLVLPGKIVGLERSAGGYVVTVRLNSLSREVRERALAQLAGGLTS